MMRRPASSTLSPYETVAGSEAEIGPATARPGISIDELVRSATNGQVQAIRGIPDDTVDRRFTRLAAAVDVYDADICDAMERQDWRLVREAMARKFVALASEHLYGLLVDASFEGLV